MLGLDPSLSFTEPQGVKHICTKLLKKVVHILLLEYFQNKEFLNIFAFQGFLMVSKPQNKQRIRKFVFRHSVT